MRWLGLGRRESKRGEPTTPVVQLREPEPRLVEVVIDAAYVAAVENRLGPMVLGRRPAQGGVGLLFEFDATSDEIAERMGFRAVNRIGIAVVSSTALRADVVGIGARL